MGQAQQDYYLREKLRRAISIHPYNNRSFSKFSISIYGGWKYIGVRRCDLTRYFNKELNNNGSDAQVIYLPFNITLRRMLVSVNIVESEYNWNRNVL